MPLKGLGIEVMTTLQANIDNLIVGSILGVEALGLYYFAFNAGLGVSLGLVNSFGTAVFPHLCEVRGNPAMLANRFAAARASRRNRSVVKGWTMFPASPEYVTGVLGMALLPMSSIALLQALDALVLEPGRRVTVEKFGVRPDQSRPREKRAASRKAKTRSTIGVSGLASLGEIISSSTPWRRKPSKLNSPGVMSGLNH